MTQVHPHVQRGIDVGLAVFCEDHVTVEHLDDGGVWLSVAGRDIGVGWAPRFVSISVKLLPTFPKTPPYPFYLPTGLQRSSGAHVSNLTETEMAGRKVAQLSVNKPFEETDDLSARFVGVIDWLRRNA